jgi:group II intron reverse transcriptase/maturase
MPEHLSDRLEKVKCPTSNMNVYGKSDGHEVPVKHPNKGGENAPAEGVEGRCPTQENIEQPTTLRIQSREGVTRGLLGVREAARRDKKCRMTALLHHVTTDLLRESYEALKRDAAPGIDGVTWREYGEGLEGKLVRLHERVHRGTYRAQPSRRTWIEKEDGRQRPLGIASLEDKIVQQAIVTVLNSIYEEDFVGFSYGFRPKRNQHQALDALWVGIMHKKVNWILDGDIRGCFDNIDHEWLIKFLEHRIADRRVLRLIRKWLRAGVSEEGKWSATTVGTPQGAVISPLAANIYLHYVLDLWANKWRKVQAQGDMIIVRYADDFVVGFQHRADAERFLKDLGDRMRAFALELHPEKTRLIEFGRYAADNRKKRGEGKPETFDFLGLTHFCGKTLKSGRFIVKRKTKRKRLISKFKEIQGELRNRMHDQVTKTAAWLKSVIQGYFNYHAVPGNRQCLDSFRTQIIRYWLLVLRRRSQKYRLTWQRYRKLVDRWVPHAKILHPYPSERFYAMHPR